MTMTKTKDLQDHDQDRDSKYQDRDQDFQNSVSRRLETKTQVSRTPSLNNHIFTHYFSVVLLLTLDYYQARKLQERKHQTELFVT